MSIGWGYIVQAYWGPRRETPQQLAIRFRRMLGALKTIDVAFDDWDFAGPSRFWPMPSSPEALAKRIDACIARDDDDDPLPMRGYQFGAGTRVDADTSLTIMIDAGNYVPNAPYLANVAELRTKPLNDQNASFITQPVFNAAVLAIAAAWDATWCAAYPWDLIPFWVPATITRRPRFNMAWITYLSRRFARMVTPPASAIVDYTWQGGIVMTATQDRFDVANPAHLAAAREIEVAMAPVNLLPWPPDARLG